MKWPARVEVMGEAPWLVVDGAHNVASAAALAETLRTSFPETTRTLVFGTTRDKDLAGQLRALLPLFDAVIATRYALNPRSVSPDEVAAAALAIDGRAVRVEPDPAEALAAARRLTPPEGLICVTGSLFLAAEAKIGDTSVYVVESEYAGIFRIGRVPQEHMLPLIMIEAPRLLFPFSRQLIAAAVQAGGFPPLFINPVDFVQLYRDRQPDLQEAIKAAQEQDAGKAKA